METNNLTGLVSTLPPHFQALAIQQYTFSLCDVGNLKEAHRLFNQFCGISGFADIKAEIARLLICAFAFQNDHATALRIYAIFKSLGDSGKVHAERIKASHILIYKLLPDHLLLAYKIWLALSEYPLPDILKWHWAQDGITLLKQCRKQSNLRLAQSIYALMGQFGQCDNATYLLEEAEQVLVKMSFESDKLN